MLLSITAGLDLTVFANNETSGQCGGNVYYSYDNTTHTLTISGTGSMYDYNFDTSYNRKISPFKSDNRIMNLIVQSGVTTIGSYAFNYCIGITSVSLPKTIELINNGAFFGCVGISEIKIPENVSEIGSSAFSGCSGLNSIELSDNVQYIGSNAFDSCTGLKEAVLGNNVSSIEKDLFYGCTGLKSISIGNCAQTISACAFYNCKSLKKFVIPDSVETIADKAFYNCEKLENVSFGSGLLSIGYESFYGCSALSSVILPDNVSSIGDLAFFKCKKLYELTLPKYIVSIGTEAFKDCYILQKIVVPDYVTIIGEGTFENCSSAKVIEIGENVVKINNSAFSGCSAVESIIIPNKTTDIGYDSFQNCSNLREIVFGERVTNIASYAFEGCVSLTSITLPISISNIYNDAFDDCTSINDVYYAGTIQEFSEINIDYKTNYSAEDYEEYGYDNICLIYANIHCSDGTIVKRPLPKVVKEEHIHHYVQRTTKATLVENGSVTKLCDDCGVVSSYKTIYRPAKFKLSTVKYIYNGKAKKPTVSVHDCKGNTISSNCYSVSYTNNKNVGKATVKITFKGNYSGSVTKSFTINPKATSISDANAKTKGFSIKWNKVSAQCDGYQIQYSENSSFNSYKSTTVNGYNNTQKTVSKLKGKKKYYVRIRTFKKVKGVNYYSSWSKAKPVTTK